MQFRLRERDSKVKKSSTEIELTCTCNYVLLLRSGGHIFYYDSIDTSLLQKHLSQQIIVKNQCFQSAFNDVRAGYKTMHIMLHVRM